MTCRRLKNPSLHLATACSVAVFVFTSCGGYRGYMTRSYNERGQHYQPMSVDAALDYEETGTCSWYNESKFFGRRIQAASAIGGGAAKMSFGVA